MDYEVIKRAGMTQQEFADLVQFSRPTVNLWINGRKTPGAQSARLVELALQVIARATEEKRLPSNAPDRGQLLKALSVFVLRQAATTN